MLRPGRRVGGVFDEHPVMSDAVPPPEPEDDSWVTYQVAHMDAAGMPDGKLRRPSGVALGRAVRPGTLASAKAYLYTENECAEWDEAICPGAWR